MKSLDKLIYLSGLALISGYMSITPVDATSYLYDDSGRLIKVNYNDGSSIDYVYDNNSNLLVVDQLTPPAVPPPITIESSEENQAPVEIMVDNGSQNIVLLRFELNQDYETELSSLSLQTNQQGDGSAAVQLVRVYEDINQDGLIDDDDIVIGEGSLDATGLFNLVLPEPYTMGTGERLFIVAYDF